MITLRSPAKINYFLKVIKRRQDGFHDLATLLQAIDFFDTIHFEKTTEDSLTSDHPSLPTDQNNFILKAFSLFRKKTGIPCFVKAHLIKKIPIEAGLGGGSSNAATALWAINQLAGKVASNEELLKWSADIGSDIPFFFSTGTGFCTGRGEKVESQLPLSLKSPFWIIKPQLSASTPAIFNAFTPEPSDQHENHFMEVFNSTSDCFNELEETVFSLYPELKRIKKEHNHACMTGTGTAFFVMDPEVSAEKEDFVQKVNPIQRALCDWY